MNGAPDWQDGECCFRCRTQFSLVARKHHCRNCGNIFCAKCSSQQIPLPKLNIEKNVRVCDSCYEKLSGKDDSLALVLDKSPEGSKSTVKSETKSNATNNSKSSSSGNKQASAPSEQDLKEEEELQLALALSLSEAPIKISFPDCKQFEDNNNSSASSTTSHRAELQSSAKATSQQQKVSSISSSSTSTFTNTNIAHVPSMVATIQPVVPSVLDEVQVNLSAGADKYHQLTAGQHQSASFHPDQPNIDQELFRFVAECQSAAEVFTNRVNSNKLRNRPIANDPAIQKQFLDLTNMQTKLLESIKLHDVQRSSLEAIQDKLSQISDARAALDALREEHQEKVRQEAAEAERQRHSQLALKLEMMRQKKSEMMQYQRELALQRIQAQEMMLNQQQAYPPAPPQSTTSIPHQPVSAPPTVMSAPNVQQVHEVPAQTTVPYQQPSIQHLPNQLSQQLLQQPFQQQVVSNTPQYSLPIQTSQPILHQPPQPVPVAPKPEDEALLISFDD